MVYQENNKNQVDQSNDNWCCHVDVCRSSIKLQAMPIKNSNKNDWFCKVIKNIPNVRVYDNEEREREKEKKMLRLAT